MLNLANTHQDYYAVYALRSDGQRSHFVGFTTAHDNAGATHYAMACFGNPYGYEAEPIDETTLTNPAGNIF